MHSDGSALFEFTGTRRFQVLRRLGGGGMGVVYEAFDRERHARVALKTLKSLDATALLRFKNEFRWLQDLQHPNLVSFGELFSEGGQWFFTMELVEGVDFLTWVRGGSASRAASSSSGSFAGSGSRTRSSSGSLPRPLPEGGTSPGLLGATLPHIDPAALEREHDELPRFDDTRLRSAMAQLARGLSALHAASKVHRDIKPTNILVTPKGRVVLLDFGLAKELSGPGQSDSHVVGTVAYMAPEQAASKPVGPEADWYSVGTLLFEALTGGLPFAGAPLEVLMAKQHHTPSPARALNPSVPPDLDQLCAELLKADPKQRPGGPEILRRLGLDESIERAPTARPKSGPAAPFIGRHQEIEQLGAALADTLKGKESAQPVTVLVQGESGVGKSALVRRFTEELSIELSSAVVLAGRCYERESVPYKALDGVIDALSRYMMRLPKVEAAALLPVRAALLGQVFPVLRRVEAIAQAPLRRHEAPSPQELRARVFAALRELLQRLAERHPLVLVIDDLQWADADSLALLAELMRPPEAPALLLLGTVRVSSDSQATGSGGLKLTQTLTGDVRHVNLKRLPPGEARELVALLLGRAAGADPQAAQAIADEAGGHPLFIDELVRHIAAGGESGGKRWKLDDALWARVERLEPKVRELLELIVVAGAPLAQETTAQAAAIEFAELHKRVGLLRVANLVRTGGARRTDTVEPYHDRVREAVLGRLHPRVRKQRHERLALALEAAGRADAEALCTHWYGAGDRERAAHYAALAAERAGEALAFDRAARLYRMALELRPIEGAAYQAKLGAVLASAGRGGDAGLAYLEAAKGASPAESMELQRKAAEQLLISGHVDTGLAALGRVLEELDMKLPSTPPEALRSLAWQRLKLRVRGLGWKRRDATQVPPTELHRIDLCSSVAIGLSLVDTVRGADYQARHLLLALDAGEPHRVVRGFAGELVYCASTGWRSRQARVEAAIERLTRELTDPHTLAFAGMARGVRAFLTGEFAEARQRLSEAGRLLRERCTGVAWELDTTEHIHLASLWYLGALRELAERSARHLRSAYQRGDLFASTNLRTGLNMLWLLRDEPERARREADEAIHKWSRQGFHTQHTYHLIAQAQAALYSGDGAAALELLRERWPALERSQQLRIELFRVLTLELKARALIAAAARDAARRPALLAEAAALAQKLAAIGRAFPSALALLLEAQLQALGGSADAAVALFARAAESAERAGLMLYAQAARRRRGQLVGGEHGRAEVEACDRWLTDEKAKNPERLCALLAPGVLE